MTVRRNTDDTAQNNDGAAQHSDGTAQRTDGTVQYTVCVMQNATLWCKIHNMKELAKLRLEEEQQFVFL